MTDQETYTIHGAACTRDRPVQLITKPDEAGVRLQLQLVPVDGVSLLCGLLMEEPSGEWSSPFEVYRGANFGYACALFNATKTPGDIAPPVVLTAFKTRLDDLKQSGEYDRLAAERAASTEALKQSLAEDAS